MTRNRLTVSTAFAVTAMAGSLASADFVTFDLVWEGIHGSSASATGSVTIDTSASIIAFGGDYDFGPIDGSPFSDFTITIVDASEGNGTFTQAGGDFIDVQWNSLASLDLSTNLVGQADFLDFNVFANVDGAPLGTDVFILSTNWNLGDGTGADRLQLVSMTANIAAVPLPAGVWAGLGLLGVMGIRRRLSR